MRDKLIKYHRKAAFYRFRKFCIALSLVAGFAVIAAIPLSVSLVSLQSNAKAQDSIPQTSEVVESSVESGDSVVVEA